ncbi:hypothetical protein LUI11_15470 [Bradyrhizobium diazoefficiens]|uniref:Uncharacterized protein n=1 Tax=Bradyrhizobium diazoefficiens SEMIA 5080 TaxID=754504 RepID=A0A837CKY8_9BRAD|nr:hypothetical protein [Bradyrhizobium diazoefficiens]WAX24307.1 hypothetical protein [Bradyrhizobium phage ppBdUSDA122-1]APO53488.1 hypothetical protein BD122_24485 [Bradyrhizobium diazoefficiens]KGJ69987.1 hypothetical protein BJA5080_04248 [Bradyrhizobium diazoefficiens SEMIA 5080]KOY09329.1 hypothetical protein AF336_15255 [Bradyrhizobium diazoefficiens]MCD9294924.1 hypothetical protein [Bradyrhizobium diazoefficiens]
MANLRACGCGTAFLPHRDSQKFCSRRCAALARPPRPARPRGRRAAGQQHQLVLRLLDIQPLERRARGGWRFGTRRISDGVAERLIASGRAEIVGGHYLQLVPQETGEAT